MPTFKNTTVPLFASHLINFPQVSLSLLYIYSCISLVSVVPSLSKQTFKTCLIHSSSPFTHSLSLILLLLLCISTFLPSPFKSSTFPFYTVSHLVSFCCSVYPHYLFLNLSPFVFCLSLLCLPFIFPSPFRSCLPFKPISHISPSTFAV